MTSVIEEAGLEEGQRFAVEETLRLIVVLRVLLPEYRSLRRFATGMADTTRRLPGSPQA